MRTSDEYLAQGSTEMTLSLRILSISWAIACALAVIPRAPVASAAQDGPRHVSVSTEADGSRSVAMYRVPTGMTLLVTQACQEHPAMYVEVGDRGERISYNGHGCTRFEPGFAVPGGETLNCVNKSGQARTCVLLGLLEQSERGVPQGARIQEVDAAE